MASAATDVFHKEDVQTLAQAVDQHDHTAGKGHSINTTPANASITNAMLASDVARANLLTDGAFEIWQRGNGPFTTNGAYTADRWLISLGSGSTMSVARQGSGNPDTLYAAALTYTHGAAVSSLQQDFKGDDAVQLRKTLSLSMRVWANTANMARIGIYDQSTSSWTQSSVHLRRERVADVDGDGNHWRYCDSSVGRCSVIR